MPLSGIRMSSHSVVPVHVLYSCYGLAAHAKRSNGEESEETARETYDFAWTRLCTIFGGLNPVEPPVPPKKLEPACVIDTDPVLFVDLRDGV